MKVCPHLLNVKLEPVNIEQDVYALVIDSIKNEYMTFSLMEQKKGWK